MRHVRMFNLVFGFILSTRTARNVHIVTRPVVLALNHFALPLSVSFLLRKLNPKFPPKPSFSPLLSLLCKGPGLEVKKAE